MTRLVTLAHRVSSLYRRYSKIHRSVFAFSLSGLIPGRNGAKPRAACRYQYHLAELARELKEVQTLVAGDQELLPATTLGREFTEALEQYMEALLDSIVQLEAICTRLCNDSKGVDLYAEDQSRDDRINYDRSVQIYQRCGERLGLLFKRL